jgi:hypothetical protein
VSHRPCAKFRQSCAALQVHTFCAVHKHSVASRIYVTFSNTFFLCCFGNIVPTARHVHVDLSFISLLSEIDPALPLAKIYLLYRLNDIPNSVLERLFHLIANKYGFYGVSLSEQS